MTLQAVYYLGPRENLQALLFFAERGESIGRKEVSIMAKSKVSQKDTPRQEAIPSSPPKEATGGEV